MTAEQAVALAVQDGDWVDYGFGGGFPELLDKALAARKGELKDIKVRGGLVIRPRIEVVECDPDVVILSSAIFKDPDGIEAGVRKCRKSLDDAAAKFGLK